MHISDALYYRRRYAEELIALRRAVTPEAAARRSELVSSYAEKLRGLGMAPTPSPSSVRPARTWILD